jgi:hypothetical protein
MLSSQVPHDLETAEGDSELRLYEDITYGQWGLVMRFASAINKQSLKDERRTDFMQVTFSLASSR